MKDVIISAERLTLRFPLPEVSAKVMATAMAHPDTVRYMSAIPTMDYSGEDAESFLDYLATTGESDSDLQLGVFLKDTDEFIGMCSLEAIDKAAGSAELGYWLRQDMVGKDLMFESASALIAYAKTHLGLRRIDAFVITEHKRSISLLERLGFRLGELRPNDVQNKGVPTHRYHYILIM